MDRATALERLVGDSFDLLVIGAGMIGARVAYEAALGGAKVALVDAGDFGGATSGASSKLIHGGLRYLQMGDLRLVRESHLERRALLDGIAAHLVRPLQFLLPIYRGGPHRAATIGAGLLLYSALSGFRHSSGRLVGVERARRLVPSLKTAGMRWAGLYEDAQTHDSRLVLATVTAASEAGAIVAGHLPVTALEQAAGRVVGAVAGGHRIRARAVVNAAGPWVDGVRLMEDPRAEPLGRLSKGVHLVLEPPEPWGAAVTVALPDGRVTFAVPWEGMLLLGTTDTAYTGDPGRAAVEPADVAAILGEAAIALPAELLQPSRIRHSFAGLRVLPRVAGATPRAPREHLVRTGPLGMVSVAGGKLTTHRRIAIDVLRRLPAFRGRTPSPAPLPGAGPPPPPPAAVDPEVWVHLLHLYGDRAGLVLESGSSERVHPGGPDVWAQVEYAATEEWAATVEDVVRRHTTLEIRGLATPVVRQQVAATLARRGVLNASDGR